MKSTRLITKMGKAIKINAKPSKKQSTANNNCITAIDNATPYATLTIKNRAIETIIFFHPSYPFDNLNKQQAQARQPLQRKTKPDAIRRVPFASMKSQPGCSFHVPFRGYGNLCRNNFSFPIRIATHPIFGGFPGTKQHRAVRITRQGSRREFDISRPSLDCQSPTIKPCHCRTIVQINRAFYRPGLLPLLRGSFDIPT